MDRLFNIAAEQALLGALLCYNEHADKLGRLATHHFYEPVHAHIFTLAMNYIAKDLLASAVTLKGPLADHAGFLELGGLDYLAGMCGTMCPPSAIGDFARLIVELSARRDLVAGLDEAKERIEAFEDIDDAAERLDDALSEARHQTSRKPSSMIFAKAATLAMERINEAVQRGTGVDIPTGIPELDEALGGFSDDELIVLGGRPSMGKTALAVEIMRRQARAGLEGIYWSGEMSEESIAIRMIAAEAHEGVAS